MSLLRILDAANAAELKAWQEIYSTLPAKEVQANPAYVRLFANQSDRAVCALWQDAKGTILFPFILRALSEEDWAGADNDATDLITPYGYGGPYAWGEPDNGAFWCCFEEWARQNKAVSLFARLSLFPEQSIPFHGEVEAKSANIVRTLDLEPDEIWMDYSHKVRKNVKKAQRNGLTVEIDEQGSRLEEFLEIYYSTLDRRNALGGYYFEREFFNAIVTDLPGQSAFFHTLLDGKVISTELVLISDNHIYSFLGGTIVSSYDLRPNDLLKHEIILWGHFAGKKAYILGGGYHDQDGIFQYKKSFAPGGEVMFRVGKKIFDPDRYAQLVEKRGSLLNGSRSTVADYFPAYRV